MEEKTDIGNHIAGHFLHGESEVKDPVLTEWLGDNEANRKLFRQYERIWNESGHYSERAAFDADIAWEKMNKINRKKEQSGRFWRRIYYAASGAAASVLVMLALSFFGLFEDDGEVFVQMEAGYGSRSTVTLPDGTAVRLNSGSAVTYSSGGKRKIREVAFRGEGFFDVSKSDRPFVIKLHNGPDVRVLGTSFNLQAYPEDPVIRASLIEGRVELIYKDEKFVMNSGDMVAFDKETSRLEPVDGILSQSCGWMENKLYMYDMSLADVCKHLERWYDVRITLPPDLGREIHYNGVLQEETILDAIKALSGLSKIAYHVKGKNISITSK